MNGKKITNTLFSIIILFGIGFALYGIFFDKSLFSNEPTNHQIERGLTKIDTFLNKCTDQYQIKIANNQYQFKCDAGYILVEPYVLDAFNSRGN
ncbi:hypothetical protein [Providencia huaxiensis]|uniref:hypothetical protein n=1 Tax=Providencia huaxiensis TaxID=2027290 RepID=UPI000C7EFFCD|nr:hypothetical protein [Providencia huaxiensis]AXH60528.1 hypothetical protein CYG50_00055 [Providencia huaxiensis]